MTTTSQMCLKTCDPVPGELGFISQSQTCSTVSALPCTIHLVSVKVWKWKLSRPFLAWKCESESLLDYFRPSTYHPPGQRESEKLWKWKCESVKVKLWKCENVKLKVWKCESVKVWKCESESVKVKVWKRPLPDRSQGVKHYSMATASNLLSWVFP